MSLCICVAACRHWIINIVDKCFSWFYLLEYLIQNGHMKEEDARVKFCQIVKAVDYCHRHNIVHRDLKVGAML